MQIILLTTKLGNGVITLYRRHLSMITMMIHSEALVHSRLTPQANESCEKTAGQTKV